MDEWKTGDTVQIRNPDYPYKDAVVVVNRDGSKYATDGSSRYFLKHAIPKTVKDAKKKLVDFFTNNPIFLRHADTASIIDYLKEQAQDLRQYLDGIQAQKQFFASTNTGDSVYFTTRRGQKTTYDVMGDPKTGPFWLVDGIHKYKIQHIRQIPRRWHREDGKGKLIDTYIKAEQRKKQLTREKQQRVNMTKQEFISRAAQMTRSCRQLERRLDGHISDGAGVSSYHTNDGITWTLIPFANRHDEMSGRSSWRYANCYHILRIPYDSNIPDLSNMRLRLIPQSLSYRRCWDQRRIDRWYIEVHRDLRQ